MHVRTLPPALLSPSCCFGGLSDKGSWKTSSLWTCYGSLEQKWPQTGLVCSARQRGLITAGFQLFWLPHLPAPHLGFAQLHFPAFWTPIYIYIYVCLDKRDFCSVGQLFKEAINGKTHLSPLVLHHPYISKQFNGVFPIYLPCSFIIWSH